MTFKSLALASSIALAGLALGGCASTQETMMSKGYSAAYSAGYADGCTSGKQAGGSMFDEFKKNVKRYGSDKEYKSGWDDGYKQCEKKEEAIEKSAQNAQRTAVERQIERDLAKKK